MSEACLIGAFISGWIGYNALAPDKGEVVNTQLGYAAIGVTVLLLILGFIAWIIETKADTAIKIAAMDLAGKAGESDDRDSA